MTHLEKERIKKAIMTMHGLADYYGALNMLCDMVGWERFLTDLDPPEKMNRWANQYAKVPKSIIDSDGIEKPKYRSKRGLPYPLGVKRS